MDIAPRFWTHLVGFSLTSQISSPIEVREELIRHTNDGSLLNDWVRRHSNSLFTNSDSTVEQQRERVDVYVNTRYAHPHAERFLRGADPWLIAHAIASGGSIVTNETLRQEPGPNRNTGLIDTMIKIPNVASQFGVETVSLPAMLRALGVNDL